MVSNIFYFHPENWGRFPIWLTFFRWVETTNQDCLETFGLEPTLATKIQLPGNSLWSFWDGEVTSKYGIKRSRLELPGYILIFSTDDDWTDPTFPLKHHVFFDIFSVRNHFVLNFLGFLKWRVSAVIFFRSQVWWEGTIHSRPHVFISGGHINWSSSNE